MPSDVRKPRALSGYPCGSIEAMEPRLLLSRAVPIKHPVRLPSNWHAKPIAVSHLIQADSGGSTTPYGKTPSQIRTAYGVGSINFNGNTGDGTGETIAIIDAYDDPNASSDLDAFDAYFNLPNPPSFQKLNEYGSASSLPGTDPAGPNAENGTWEEEESLDIEWAHVMAPGANIILYEASDSGSGLFTAVQSADANSAVNVVSMSWGGGQSTGETSYNAAYFNTSGVTYVASTGDSGTPAEMPASLANVVAVGGTSLYTADSSGTYSSESGWSGSGGGIDTYDPQPSYQSFTVAAQSTTNRTTPDVSIDADPGTGVPIYDSWDFGTATPWLYGYEGGTSLAAPMWAGLVSIADQGRALEGLSSLSGISKTLPRLYQLPASNYHDITTGSNGLPAGPGYDLNTGIGTPIANLLAPDLAGAGKITGRVFVDNTGTGVYGGSDSPLSGKTVYLDLNNDGVKDNNEPSATTNSSGGYVFTDQPAGGTVRLSSPNMAGYVAVPSTAGISYGATDTINFTYFPTSFSTTVASKNYTLQSDSTGSYDQILINNTLTYSIAKSALGSTALSFSLTGTGDSFTVNGSNGNPIPAGGITLTGSSAGDAVIVDGTAGGNDSFVVTSQSIIFNGNPFNFSNVSLLTLNPGAGIDSLAVNSGSVSIAVQTPGSGILSRNFSSISIAASAHLIFPTAPAHSDRMLIQTASLSDAGQLDLGGNDLIVHNGNLAAITALLASGYNGGAWNGAGIDSTAAATDTTRLTALGAVANSFYGQAGQPLFDGIAPSPTDILVKYTYYGDANLDGKIDGTDYNRLDSGLLFAATGWANGDFNYDGTVNGTDYALIDNSFNTQGPTL
jgi:subtilase family serine protease